MVIADPVFAADDHDDPDELIQAMDMHILIANSFMSTTSDAMLPTERDGMLNVTNLQDTAIARGHKPVKRISDNRKQAVLD